MINEAVVRHFQQQGVGQVRAYSGDEEGLTALRDRLQTADVAMAARVKYYIGDVNDPAILLRRWMVLTSSFMPRL